MSDHMTESSRPAAPGTSSHLLPRDFHLVTTTSSATSMVHSPSPPSIHTMLQRDNASSGSSLQIKSATSEATTNSTMTAAQAVFDTYELLALIIVLLPSADVRRLHRLSPAWNAVSKSQTVCKARALQPAEMTGLEVTPAGLSPLNQLRAKACISRSISGPSRGMRR